MIRKTLTSLSLVMLVASVELWGVSLYGIEYRQTDDCGNTIYFIKLRGGCLERAAVPAHLWPSKPKAAAKWSFGREMKLRTIRDSVFQRPYFSAKFVIVPLWLPSSCFVLLS